MDPTWTRPTNSVDVPGTTDQESVTNIDGSFIGSSGLEDSVAELPPLAWSDHSIGRVGRPHLDQRSVSSPHTHTPPISRSGTSPQPGTSWRTNASSSPLGNRNTTGRMRSARPGKAADQQWTLFGQLMENELRGSETRRDKRLSSRLTIPSTSTDSNALSSSVMEDGEIIGHSPVETRPASASQGDVFEDDVDYDSDSSDTSVASRRSTRVEFLPAWYSPQHIPTLSNLHRSIFKCVLAYFIASLFTFTPYLASFISDITSDDEPGKNPPSPAGHMVATV